MSRAGLEPTISVLERAKTVDTLEPGATLDRTSMGIVPLKLRGYVLWGGTENAGYVLHRIQIQTARSERFTEPDSTVHPISWHDPWPFHKMDPRWPSWRLSQGPLAAALIQILHSEISTWKETCHLNLVVAYSICIYYNWIIIQFVKISPMRHLLKTSVNWKTRKRQNEI
jgi:hypothetical protein